MTQIDDFKQLSDATPTDVPAVPSLDAAASLVATPPGILLPPPQAPVQPPTLTAPGTASPTNAAPPPAPGSFAAKFGAAAAKLMGAGSSPMSALVSAGVHALSQPTDTPAPSNTSWQAAQTNADATRPTTSALPAQPSNGQKVINSVAANLGDISAATEGGTAGGPIAGAFRVLKEGATRQRMEQENAIKMATANAQMLHEQQLLHKTGEDAVQASMAIGKQSADEMLAAPHAETIASGKTSDELKQMIDSKAIDISRDAVFLTGRVLTGNDKNGLPMFRSTYTVIKPGERIAPSAENIQFLNKYLPGQDFKEPDEDGKGGQTFDSHTYYMLNQRAMNRFADVQAIMKTTAETEDKVHKAMLEKGSQDLRDNQFIQAAIRDVAPVKGGDPFLFQKAFNILAREAALDPNIAKALPKNWQEQFAYTYGGGEPKKFEDQMTQLSKLQEKVAEAGNDMLDIAMNKPQEMEGHTPAFQAALTKIANDPTQSPDRRQKANDLLQVVGDIRAGELQMEKDKAAGKKEGTGFQGDPSATTPEAFLNSLSPDEASLVKQIGTGKIVLARMDYLATRKPEVLEAVGRAFPDFDSSKAQSYPSTYKDFTSGKTAIALNAGGTAMGHLKELMDLNTVASHIAHTPAWTAYQNKADTLATELAKFYGDATIPAIHSIKETLTSTLPGNRAAAIKTQAQSMNDKLEAFEQQWKNAAPSKAYEAPLPFISTRAKQAFASLNPQYAAAHPELNAGNQQVPTTQQQQSPTPGSSKFAGKVGVNVPATATSPARTIYFDNQQQADNFKKEANIR